MIIFFSFIHLLYCQAMSSHTLVITWYGWDCVSRFIPLHHPHWYFVFIFHLRVWVHPLIASYLHNLFSIFFFSSWIDLMDCFQEQDFGFFGSFIWNYTFLLILGWLIFCFHPAFGYERSRSPLSIFHFHCAPSLFFIRLLPFLNFFASYDNFCFVILKGWIHRFTCFIFHPVAFFPEFLCILR